MGWLTISRVKVTGIKEEEKSRGFGVADEVDFNGLE